eukprot:6636629-Alexandrium_andersonii.AAC.1
MQVSAHQTNTGHQALAFFNVAKPFGRPIAAGAPRPADAPTRARARPSKRGTCSHGALPCRAG